MKSWHEAVRTLYDQQKVMTLACGFREWLQSVPIVVNQSVSLLKQWASLTELCTGQKASELPRRAPEAVIYFLVTPKSAKPAKASLRIIVIINWLLAIVVDVISVWCSVCCQMCSKVLFCILLMCMSHLLCHPRDHVLTSF